MKVPPEERQRPLTQELLEELQAGIMLLDESGRVRLWNRAATLVTGYSSEDLVGQAPSVLFPTEPDYQQFWRDVQRYLHHHNDGIERLLRRRDGSFFWCRFSGRRLPMQLESGGSLWVLEDLSPQKRSEETLRRQREQLLQQNRGLQERVAALQRTVASTEEAASLEAAFAANVGHELRTPLHAVIGMASALLQMELSEKQREYAETISAAGASLLRLLEDILDYSTRKPSSPPASRPFNLLNCIHDAMDALVFQARRKGLTLIPLIYHDVPEHVMGDVHRLRQVLVNLLANAIKYTDCGEIVLQVRLRGAERADAVRVVIDIIDTGVGLVPEQVERILEPPRQTRSSESGGQGLHIVRQLVATMRGSISVNSRPGAGTTFTLDFTVGAAPASPAASAEKTPATALDGMPVLLFGPEGYQRKALREQLLRLGGAPRMAANVAELVRALECRGKPAAAVAIAPNDPATAELKAFLEASFSAEELPVADVVPQPVAGEQRSHHHVLTAPVYDASLLRMLRKLQAAATAAEVGPTAGVAPGRKSVLVVEDDEVSAAVAAAMLAQVGEHGETCATGREALRRLGEREYLMVLLDLQLPDMDGLEVARQIRAKTCRDIDVPVVALTAHTEGGVRTRCREAGIDLLLTKPCTLECLRGALQLLLRFSAASPREEGPAAGSYAAVELADAAAPALDMRHLALLSAGETGFEERLLNAALGELDRRVADIESALGSRDWAAARKEAHAVRSAALNVGARRIEQAAHELERQCADDSAQALATHCFSMLRIELERLRQTALH